MLLNGAQELGRFRAGPSWQEHTAFTIGGGLLEANGVVIEIRSTTAPRARRSAPGRRAARPRGVPRRPRALPLPAQLTYGAHASRDAVHAAQVAFPRQPASRQAGKQIDRSAGRAVSKSACLGRSDAGDQPAVPTALPRPAALPLPAAAACCRRSTCCWRRRWRYATPERWPAARCCSTCWRSAGRRRGLARCCWQLRATLRYRCRASRKTFGSSRCARHTWRQLPAGTTDPALDGVLRADGFYNLGYPLLLWLARPLTGDNPFLAARLVAALGGALLLLAGWLLARRLLGRSRRCWRCCCWRSARW